MHHHLFYGPPNAQQLTIGLALAAGMSVTAWPNIFCRVSRFNVQGMKQIPLVVRVVTGAVSVVPLAVLSWRAFAADDLRFSFGFMQIGLGLTFLLGGVARVLQDRSVSAAAALEAYLGSAMILIATESLYMDVLPPSVFPITMPGLAIIGGVLVLWWVVASYLEGRRQLRTQAER